METKPTHEQAQLQLKVYDQRREARLRQARDWFFKNYFVETLQDVMRVAPMGTDQGAFAMMVLTYWDQVCALLNYGLLHEDLFFETNGEFFGVWERVSRGRDGDCSPPPARTRTGAINASGSYRRENGDRQRIS